MQDFLPGIELTDRQSSSFLNLSGLISRSIAALQLHEPPEGYYGAFSGGKDSVTIKKLAAMAGVRVEWWYNNVTIDPPELVRFVKSHPDVRWNNPIGRLTPDGPLVTINMMHRVATAPKVAPTRLGRWCCSEYKEGGGKGRVKIFGVRAAESKGRARRWKEWAEDLNGDPVVCPIVFWSDADVWQFIRSEGVAYCSLYDEGFTRLGCVDCPLASNSKREAERKRWPKLAENWKKAVIANWEKWKDLPNTKTGAPRFQAQFETGEDYYRWWATGSSGTDVMRECQSGMLWTNEEEEL